MERTTVLTKIFLFLFLISSYFISAQGKEKDSLSNGWERMSYQKEKVFINFNQYQDNCTHKDIINNLKKRKKKGWQFSLCGEAVLLYSNGQEADTVKIKNLDRFSVLSVEDIKKKVKEFRYKTYRKLPVKSNQKLYQAYDNNDIFETYLIEVISKEEFVIYPVFWRSQRVER
jgi:hypothetical protein